MIKFNQREAREEDAKQLAELRVDAMRPSLEALGRFDPDRARERFLSSFKPEETKVVFLKDEVVGFYVVRHRNDHLYLDHLYISPARQGHGIGKQIVDRVIHGAQKMGQPVKLTALKGSRANEFYKSCGFSYVSSDEFDNYYVWRPKSFD